jgi:hypothetical protein
VEDIDNEVSFQESPWDNSGMSVADQVVQKTDDGNPMVSQWTSLPDDQSQPKAGDPEPKAGDPEPKAGDPEPKAGDPEPKAADQSPEADANDLNLDPKALEKDQEPKVGLNADTKGLDENKDPDTKDPYPKALEDEVVGMTIDEIKEL